ncbi:hypothetical protein BLNAU_25164 [Blattamonas nauphoetae]|uniref:Uncharacterized protein n=1 Tax=Blattamonas nauphoetae TaxID=2049346 RepID=A0ABQ9WN44_9EUKA|nr:hypothetical protein BLNAU_25164 [Blattamonas nauphoetae]
MKPIAFSFLGATAGFELTVFSQNGEGSLILAGCDFTVFTSITLQNPDDLFQSAVLLHIRGEKTNYHLLSLKFTGGAAYKGSDLLFADSASKATKRTADASTSKEKQIEDLNNVVIPCWWTTKRREGLRFYLRWGCSSRRPEGTGIANQGFSFQAEDEKRKRDWI